MNVQMTGAQRPKLSLAYRGMIASQQPSGRGLQNLPGSLSQTELRRIVSEILG